MAKKNASTVAIVMIVVGLLLMGFGFQRYNANASKQFAAGLKSVGKKLSGKQGFGSMRTQGIVLMAGGAGAAAFGLYGMLGRKK